MTPSPPGTLHAAVHRLALRPDAARDLVERYGAAHRKKHPTASDARRQDAMAQQLVRRFARRASAAGGVTAMAGVVPGLGTAAAIVGGSTADLATTMKLQVDLCLCLACAYGHDPASPKTRDLAFLLAGGAALEHAGAEAEVPISTAEGVEQLSAQLAGGSREIIEALFKRVALVLSRKALEKALPFGIGVALGASGNYALTSFVGQQAASFFVIERGLGGRPNRSS